jgi:hypothetical protein
MNESETKDQEIVTVPKDRVEYVAPKLEQHFDYRILIAGGGSI